MNWRREKILGAIAILITVLVTCFLGLLPYLENKGWFEQWRPLGYPPQKAIKILAHENNFPFIETTDGKFYACFESFLDKKESCWVKEYSKPEFADASPCFSELDFYIPEPPGEVIDKVEYQSCEGGVWMATVQHNFVLLADGSVWAWQHTDTTPFTGAMMLIYSIGGFYSNFYL